ncbi:MAG: TRAP transporter substrate-binding protein [Bacillota bacterium]
MYKKISFFLMILVLTVIVAACGGGEKSNGGGGSDGKVTIRLAHSGSETHQYHIAAEKFKELVAEKSENQIQVEIFSNATLGGEGEVIEQVMDGTVDMTTVAADSNLANTVPEMNIFGIPYLFEDREDVYNKLDNEVGKELLEIVNQQGMKGLDYWEVGFRHLTNSKKEVKTPKDIKGMKIRVQPAPVWESHIKALGASPTPVAFNELYSALDQGVVDGQENPLATINSMKFYEVQKQVSLTAHTYTPGVVLMSENAWNSLSDEQKEIVESAVKEAKMYQRDYLEKQEKEIIQTLKDNNVTISEPDRDAFKEATIKVRETVSDQVPAELIEKMDE